MPVIDRERVGAALPGYSIGPEIGAGGFGLVLAGRHLDLERDVAIKVLSTAAAGAESSADFRTEARLLSRLEHPHIVRIFDYIDYGDQCLIVMELLSGGTLSRQRLSQEAVCAMALAVADALALTHDNGVLHRDIKPDNILFTVSGQPKITDFGIAKIVEGAGSTASRVIGTRKYMAPEQILGGRLGPPTDLYALGVLLYEQLARGPMFDPRLSALELFRHHREVVPPPPPNVPEPVAQVIMKALAKDPDDRFPNAHDFAYALARAASRSYGRDYLNRSGLVLQLPDELRDPLRHKPARRTGSTGPWTPVSGLPGGGAGGFGVLTGGGTGTFGSPRRRAALAAAAALVLLAAGLGAFFGLRGGKKEAPPAWRPVTLADGKIRTVIGGGSEGEGGDGGPALAAQLNVPVGITADASGNFYIADEDNNRVRKVDRTGVITTIAGTGVAGYSGDGGPATTAKINQPHDIAVDRAGNLYIADTGNHRVRRVNTDGTIVTVAGTGESGFSGPNDPKIGGFSGDGVPARQAQLAAPVSLAFDPAGNLIVADEDNNRVRKVSLDGFITTIAGTGAEDYDGDGGPATRAALEFPSWIRFDAAGNLYIVDQGDNHIRKMTPGGTITTVAGNGQDKHTGDGGPALRAGLPTLGSGLIVARDGTIYIAEADGHRIRKIDPRGIITTIAGTGDSGNDNIDGPARSTEFDLPKALYLDEKGYLYIADAINYIIRAMRVGGSS